MTGLEEPLVLRVDRMEQCQKCTMLQQRQMLTMLILPLLPQGGEAIEGWWEEGQDQHRQASPLIPTPWLLEPSLTPLTIVKGVSDGSNNQGVGIRGEA